MLLSGCQYKTGWTTSDDQLLQPNLSTTEFNREITFTRIAPTHETGKHSFYGLALLETGKILTVGYDGENPRRIRISSDEGKTWETNLFTDDFTMPSNIHFKDRQHGWISGSMDVFRTVDGGQNWKKTSLGTYLDFAFLSFYDLKTGFLAGRHNINGEISSQIFITKDGGDTWTKCYENNKWTNPFSILAVSENTALAVLNENKMIRTDDGGKSWKSIKSFNYRINKLKSDFNGRIWAVGRDGNFFYSIDSGIIWQRPSEFPENFESKNWSSVSFVDDRIGFAVGEKGTVLFTADGGNSWEEIKSGLEEDLYGVYMNQSYGIIKGSENVYKIHF